MNLQEKQRIIRSLYATKSNAELAMMLGMSASHICVMAFRMGLRKDPAFLSDTNRECGRYGLKAMKRGVYSEKKL